MKSDESYRDALGAAQRRIESLERELEMARSATPTATSSALFCLDGPASFGAFVLVGIFISFVVVSCGGGFGVH